MVKGLGKLVSIHNLLNLIFLVTRRNSLLYSILYNPSAIRVHFMINVAMRI